MITIRHRNAGYHVFLSFPHTGNRGYGVYARNVDEVNQVVSHHLGGGHGNFQHDDCPLCTLCRLRAGTRRKVTL